MTSLPSTLPVDAKVYAGAKLALPRTCIVSGEFVGLFQNGGLGTSMTGLAELLAACGAEVTLLYTGELGENTEEQVEAYARAGIELVLLKQQDTVPLEGRLDSLYAFGNAWRIYAYLSNRTFDVIHFNDTMGEGACCIVAKRTGLAFQDTLINLAIHSPTEWILHANRHLADWLGFACFTNHEKISMALTDVLWGPSRYLLNWLTENNYPLPKQVINQQYVVPTTELFSPGVEKCVREAEPAERHRIEPKELVFFGRLEERKGIRLFVSAISQISDFLNENNISIVFMGKSSSVGGVDASQWIDETSKDWTFNWRIESGFGQREAIAFLKSENRLAVMASPIDNSPCTVYEAIQHGIPFLASTGGGIPELVHPQDRKTHLFDYTNKALADLIKQAVLKGISAARPAISIKENQDRWLAFHRDWKKFRTKTAPAKSARKGWAAIVEHEGEATSLSQSLASLKTELGVEAQSIAIVMREGAEWPAGLDKTSFASVLDDSNDDWLDGLITGWQKNKLAGLACLRSGAVLTAGSAMPLAQSLGRGFDVILPPAKVKASGNQFVTMGTSPAYLAYEGLEDSGAMIIDLAAKVLNPALSGLDRDRYFGGLLDHLHEHSAMAVPFPFALVELENSDKLVLKDRGSQRRIHTLAKAERHSVYMAMGVGRKMYHSSLGQPMVRVKQMLLKATERQPRVRAVLSRVKALYNRVS